MSNVNKIKTKSLDLSSVLIIISALGFWKKKKKLNLDLLCDDTTRQKVFLLLLLNVCMNPGDGDICRGFCYRQEN